MSGVSFNLSPKCPEKCPNCGHDLTKVPAKAPASTAMPVVEASVAPPQSKGFLGGLFDFFKPKAPAAPTVGGRRKRTGKHRRASHRRKSTRKNRGGRKH